LDSVVVLWVYPCDSLTPFGALRTFPGHLSPPGLPSSVKLLCPFLPFPPFSVRNLRLPLFSPPLPCFCEFLTPVDPSFFIGDHWLPQSSSPNFCRRGVSLACSSVSPILPMLDPPGRQHCGTLDSPLDSMFYLS